MRSQGRTELRRISKNEERRNSKLNCTYYASMHTSHTCHVLPVVCTGYIHTFIQTCCMHMVHTYTCCFMFHTSLFFRKLLLLSFHFSSFMDTSIETKEEQRLSSQTHSTGMVQVVAKKNKEESFPSITPTPLQRTFELNPNVIDRTSLSEQHKNMLRFLRKILVSAISLQQ